MKRGFTLLELLVTVFVVSIMCLWVAAIVRSCGREQVKAALEPVSVEYSLPPGYAIEESGGCYRWVTAGATSGVFNTQQVAINWANQHELRNRPWRVVTNNPIKVEE